MTKDKDGEKQERKKMKGWRRAEKIWEGRKEGRYGWRV